MTVTLERVKTSPKFLISRPRVGPKNVHFYQVAKNIDAAGPGTTLPEPLF